MAIHDKRDLLSRIGTLPEVELELGCGPRKRKPQAIGVDIQDHPCVDLVGDVFEVLRLLPAGSVDHVSSYHFIEHVAEPAELLAELARVVKPGGRMAFTAPHFSNPYFYSDPTHRSFFGLYTFCYWAKGSPFARQVPTYGPALPLRIVQVSLGFQSTRPFYVRHAFKKLQGLVFDSCTGMREFWEENLCYLFPAYEVRYLLQRDEP